MENDKKNQKVLLRKNLICYFLAMAKGQEAIQQLQEELVMHPYFNPILIFKKISKGHMVLTQSNLKQYMATNIGITSLSGMEAYLKKHGLENIIECEQFIAAMLPYTPDILRNSQATIVWQVKSSPTLKRDIEQIFKSLIRAQISFILNIASFRKKITASWQEIKTMIKTDFKNNGTFLENRYIDSEINMIKMRKWMELWIQINEKDVLDMIRWMGGESEDSVKNYFNKFTSFHVGKCTCEKDQDYQIRLRRSVKKNHSMSMRSLSLKPLSRKELQMYQRKISYRQMPEIKKLNNKQSFHSSKSLKNIQRKPSISDHLYKEPENKRKKMDEKSISLWCQYIYTILSGQKVLTDKRASLKPDLERATEILQDLVISKKRQVTKIKKLISFIQKHVQLSSSLKKHLEKYLGNLSMSNDVIISIFNSGLSQKYIPTIQQNSPKQKKDLISLKISLAQILQNYCLTKSRLIQISKQLIKQNLHRNLYKILNPNNSKTITQETLSQLLNEMQINFGEEDIEILMKHFGDGKRITEESFFRVFEIQGN